MRHHPARSPFPLAALLMTSALLLGACEVGEYPPADEPAPEAEPAPSPAEDPEEAEQKSDPPEEEPPGIPPLGGSGGVRLPDHPSVPTVGIWTLEHPLADTAAELSIDTHTIAQDHALIHWTLAGDHPPAEPGHLSLLNTRTGAELWQREVGPGVFSYQYDLPATASDGDHAFIFGIGSISLETGEVEPVDEDLHLLGITSEPVPRALAWDPGSSTTGAYTLGGFTDPAWAVEETSVEGGFPAWITSAAVIPGALIRDGEPALNLDDGSPMPWSGDPDGQYFASGSGIFLVSDASGSTVVSEVDPETGDNLWSTDLHAGTSSVSYDASGPYVFSPADPAYSFDHDYATFWDHSTERVIAVNLASGEVAWEQDGVEEPERCRFSSPSAVFLPSEADCIAHDAATGEERYRLTSDAFSHSLGFSDSLLYAIGNDNVLSTADLHTGEPVWNLTRGENGYNRCTIENLAGALICVDDDSSTIRGVGHP